MKNKKCSRCKTEKPSDDFSLRRRKTKMSLQSWCKSCIRIKMKELYRQGPRKIQITERRIRIRKRNNLFVTSYKLKKGCAICGYNKNPYALECHHKNIKNGLISKLVRDQAPICKLKEELDLCIILCANCHRETHYKYVPIV